MFSLLVQMPMWSIGHDVALQRLTRRDAPSFIHGAMAPTGQFEQKLGIV
jgi:hypothetical protein